MTTFDRNTPGYEPRFDKDYEYGAQGELLIGDIVEAIRRDRVEIKRDGQFATTGNLYVETECFRRGRWHPSGINTPDGAEVWAFVLGDTRTCVFLPVDLLREVVEHLGRPREERDGSHPTKGSVIKLSHLMAYLQNRQKRGAA